MRTFSQLSSRILRGLSSILGDEAVDFWREQAGALSSQNRCLARVCAKTQETSDTFSFTLEFNELFEGFKAGQHLNVSVNIHEMVYTRSYSFSAHADQPRTARITVKRVPGGKVSGHLCDQVQVGDLLEVGQAFGEMTLEDTQALTSEGLLFLAAGSGVTPFMGLVEELATQGFPVPATLCFWARTPAELIYDARFEELANLNTNFNYVRIVEADANLARGDLLGRPSLVHLNQGCPDWQQRQVMACGPDGFMKAIDSLCKGKVAAFHAESFSPMVPVLDDAEVREVEVTLTRSNRIVKVASNKPLLKALQEQGINPKHGCGMGICNTCSCEKVSGTTRNLQNGTACSAGNAAVRICVNAAQSAVSLDL